MRNERGQFIKGSNGRPGNVIPADIRKKISSTLTGRYQGEDSPTWKGGRWKDEMGYIRIPIQAGSDAYVYEHRMVMEHMIGRKLKAGEMVHHINGVKHDNRPVNLRLFISRSEHVKYHATEVANAM